MFQTISSCFLSVRQNQGRARRGRKGLCEQWSVDHYESVPAEGTEDWGNSGV